MTLTQRIIIKLPSIRKHCFIALSPSVSLHRVPNFAAHYRAASVRPRVAPPDTAAVAEPSAHRGLAAALLHAGSGSHRHLPTFRLANGKEEA
eukprot:4734553-Pleurochrysis_carterae.AAC.7